MQPGPTGPHAPQPHGPQPHGALPYGALPLPPPRPSFLDRHWPGPGAAPTPIVLAGIAGSGVVAAASLPLDRPGVGWLCAGLGVTAATATAARAAHRSPTLQMPWPARLARIGWASVALALLAVGTVRAAGWLFVLCVLTACVCAGFAVGGGRTVPGLIRAAIAVPFASLRALPWLAKGLTAVRSRSSSPLRMVVVTLVSLLLLIVFGALFASADAAFSSIVDFGIPSVSAGSVARWIFLFPLVAFATLGAAYLVSAPPDLDGEPTAAATTRLRRLEWAVPLILLDLLFLTFVLVQVTVLFGGSKVVLNTADLTFAEYARRGFWQLLVVTLLTLAVIGAAARWAPRSTSRDRALIRLLLGALALLTLVIVASALYRMHVYEQAYGFTRLRVFVSAVELWLGAVFVMVLVAGVRLRAAWLARCVVASAVLVLLGLAVLNPDRFIAERNVDRFQASGRIDQDYLGSLSADAVPAIRRLPEPMRACALWRITDGLHGDLDDWLSYNVARDRGRRESAPRPYSACAPLGD